jgi:hypothetical protein
MIHHKVYVVAWKFAIDKENYKFNEQTFHKKEFAEQKIRLLRLDRKFIHPADVHMRTIIFKFKGKR